MRASSHHERRREGRGFDKISAGSGERFHLEKATAAAAGFCLWIHRLKRPPFVANFDDIVFPTVRLEWFIPSGR
jgi:hypothetical protein